MQVMVVVMQIGKRASLGFTYIGVLMLVAISGIGLSGVGIVWHQDAQREREKELLFMGEQFRKAIGSYYENSPVANKQYPDKLEDLILDNRFPVIKRHLRKLYADPMNPSKDWGLEKQQGRIVGVYSESKLKPIKKSGFQLQYEAFSTAEEYKDWKFIYTAGSLPVGSAASNESAELTAQ